MIYVTQVALSTKLQMTTNSAEIAGPGSHLCVMLLYMGAVSRIYDLTGLNSRGCEHMKR